MRGWAAAICALLLAAGVAQSVAQAESVLRRGNRWEPNSLDPHKVNTVYEQAIVLDLFEGLTAYDADGVPQPALAQSWSVSADGRTWTFALRRDARWSDGAPITADDVVYSFRRLLDPNTAAIYAAMLYGVGNARAVNAGTLPPERVAVSAPDSATVVIGLDNPVPFLPALLANGFAVVVPRQAIAAHGALWTRPQNMVASGAFVLADWVPHGGVTLARNPRYRAPAVLDRVVYEPTEDLDAAVTRFRAGQLDMQWDFPASQVATLERDLPGTVRLTPSYGTLYLPLNTRSPKLADARVRRALSLAIDRELLVERVVRGGQTGTWTFVPPTMPGYRPPEVAEAHWPRAERLARARTLLAEAGAAPLQLTLSHSTTAEVKRIVVAIAAMWKEIGVTAALEGTEGKVLFANLRQGNFEAAFAGWSAEYPDAEAFLMPLLGTSVASNYSRYANPAYDALVAKAQGTVDTAARAALLRAAEAAMLADQPIVPLYVSVIRELVAPQVQGWRANAVPIHPSRTLSVDRTVAPPQ